MRKQEAGQGASVEALRRRIQVAAGREPADLVLKNAQYVNVFSQRLCTGDVALAQGRIVGIGEYSGREELDMTGRVLCPGFVDGHIHLESSMVSPASFASAVLPHGTTGVVADPHEIANVMGVDGIEYMLQATQGLPIDVWLMLPSCVPATPMDESGARLGGADLAPFYAHPRVLGLAEVMDYVGVTENAPDLLEKLAGAQARGLGVDGHAPGLSGKGLNAYLTAGIGSDHECAALEEAREKLELGQWIMIREGTAARNLEALSGLLKTPCAARCMFCTDDKHPDDLLAGGHMDEILRRAIGCGVDPIAAVRAATLQPAQYFSLPGRGAIAPGYHGDITVVNSLEEMQVELVLKDGVVRFRRGELCSVARPPVDPRLEQRARDTFHTAAISPEDLRSAAPMGVIGMVPGEILTTDQGWADKIDPEQDILKIAVIERHKGSGHVGLGYLKGYGLKRGAVATSIAHDSHNLIVVGANEADMAVAAACVVEQRGGIAVADQGRALARLTLELAGLMSGREITAVNQELERCKQAAYALGVNRELDPFMPLSFLSLPVIPTLRVTTKGVFQVETQRYLSRQEP